MVLEKTLLRIPWTARRSNQSILKEITPEYSLEGLMLKLKLTDSWAKGFPGGASGEEPSCQSRRHKRYRFDPWVRKIPLEEGVPTNSSILAWRIPRTEEPDRLQSIGSQS